MKILDRTHYNDFLYGLIYPGFIGTMIVDILPLQLDRANISDLYKLETLVKISITAFYCLDFLHLYADMNPKFIGKKRSWAYIVCDFCSSLILFAVFLSIKWHHQHWGIILFSIVPSIILIYKKNNESDWKYFVPYSLISFLLGIFFFSIIYFSDKINTAASMNTLFFFNICSLLVYAFYVFYYYNKYSSKRDEILSGDKS
jgi:hypothetical protein